MINRIFVSLVLGLWSIFSWADPTNLGTPTSAQGHSPTASVAHTVGSGTDRVSYLFFFVNGGEGIASVANFGGVTPALVGSWGDSSFFLYRVVNPATGATTASATLVNTDTYWSVHVITLQDVHQSTPDDPPILSATNSEVASISSSAVTSAVGDLVLGFGLMCYGDISAADGATLSTSQTSIDGGVLSSALIYEAGASSVVVGVSSTSASFCDNQIGAINVNDGSGGGGPNLVPAIFEVLRQQKH